MRAAPRVSIILPAYNARHFLAEALSSSLAQSFGDFECIVIDDGSTDRTPRLIENFARQDPRIKPIRIQHGGIVPALNAGLEVAAGQFIARMDADDICLPGRLERQVRYLEENADCVAVGSSVLLIDPYGADLNEVHPAVEHEQIEADLLRASGWAMFHPSVMMRADAVRAIGGYRKEYQWSEDIDLFLRLAEAGRLANLPEVLLKYRQHFSSVNRTRRQMQLQINRQLLDEIYRRRGMGPLPGNVPADHPTMTPFELARNWGWQALANRNWPVARRHAVNAIRTGPFKYHSWTLAYRSVWHGRDEEHKPRIQTDERR
jgi:glycosyltransferase involved in cell wall biosynthesis